MRVFEIGRERLVPFHQVPPGPDLYEREIEDLLWSNLEAITGVRLFPVARQPVLRNNRRPDIVAMDAEGHVHVVEVKRDVDDGQLSQCLAYARWAGDTNSDELARMYHRGVSAFVSDWMKFTETKSPRLVQQPPTLVLVAGNFGARTDDAVSHLRDRDLSIIVLRVTIYEDQVGRRIVHVGGDEERENRAAGPSVSAGGQGVPTSARRRERDARRSRAQKHQLKKHGRHLKVSDLVDAGFIEVNTQLTWKRPQLGVTYRAAVLADGQIRLEDGRVFDSPSRAAKVVANTTEANGWVVWCVPGGRKLAELKQEYEEHRSDGLV